eukprot:g18434.t1
MGPKITHNGPQPKKFVTFSQIRLAAPDNGMSAFDYVALPHHTTGPSPTRLYRAAAGVAGLVFAFGAASLSRDSWQARKETTAMPRP